jgi:hypothetical protein
MPKPLATATLTATRTVHYLNLDTRVTVVDEDGDDVAIRPTSVIVTMVGGTVEEFAFRGPRILPDGRNARDFGKARMTDFDTFGTVGLSRPVATLLTTIVKTITDATTAS